MDSATLSGRTWTRRLILICEVVVILLLTSVREFASGLIGKLQNTHGYDRSVFPESRSISEILTAFGTMAIVLLIVWRSGDLPKFPALKVNWRWDPPLALFLVMLEVIAASIFIFVLLGFRGPSSAAAQPTQFGAVLNAPIYRFIIDLTAILLSNATLAFVMAWYLMTRIQEIISTKGWVLLICTICWVMSRSKYSTQDILIWIPMALIFEWSFLLTRRVAPIVIALCFTGIIGLISGGPL